MEISGSIRHIGSTTAVTQTFNKRELVITTEEQYPQHILIEFHQDKCSLLDGLLIGTKVKVGINLRGREWTNPQGETKYFNSIQGWKVDAGQINNFQQPQQNYQQPQSAVNNYHQNSNTSQQQGIFSPNQSDPNDDLPF